MLSGLIIYSRIDKEKNSWFINRCIENLSKKGISLIYKDDSEVLECLKDYQIDFVIYRSRDYQLLAKLEEKEIRCFNNSLTNHIANDKFLTYQFLTKQGIACITSYDTIDDLNDYPVVMKSVSGHGGSEVFLLNKKEETESYKEPHKKYIYQPFCPNDGDLRLYVLNKKVVGAVLRYNANNFRSNFSLGGEAMSYHPNEQLTKIAEQIAKLLNADYIGVDFLRVNNKWLVNEIEDPVGARMLFKASGIDITTLLTDYISQTLINK